MIRRFLKNYLPRHRNRWNQFLHLLGVPATFVGTPWCLIAEKPWYWAAAFFAGGYFL
ncbi:MAG: Mpo1-like protein, partial [Planctomyces sp.]